MADVFTTTDPHQFLESHISRIRTVQAISMLITTIYPAIFKPSANHLPFVMMRRSNTNPFDEIERVFEQMNESFGDVSLPMGLHDIDVDVAETETEVVVTADLPGFGSDDIDITLSGRDLTIEADRESETEESDARYVRRERSHSRLSRTVYLPDEVEEESARASYRNGVLTVTLQRESAEPDDDSHRIDID